MSEEISGRGDPLWLLETLWGKSRAPKRGPKPKASLEDVVSAAVAIADAEGIEAVSMRRVAEAAGLSTMALYTHLPSKSELLDLMLDHVTLPGTAPPPEWDAMGWRERAVIVAYGLWEHYLAHPWALQIETHRPVLGPNTMAAYEVALSALDGIGLDELEMDLTITALANYVVGSVRNAAREKRVLEATGMNDTEWWYKIAPFLETIDYSPYPVSARVGPVAGAEYGAGDYARAFRFGLDMLLDGIEIRLGRKGGPDR